MDVSFKNCIVLYGKDLVPYYCNHFQTRGDHIVEIDLGEKCTKLNDGALVVIPGLYNSHTHLGDSAFPDATIEMTLEEGFFRPNGFKYRALKTIEQETHEMHLRNHLLYMAKTASVAHIDFREQGVEGAQRLNRASEAIGVESIILSQFNELPFDQAALDKNTEPLSSGALAELEQLLYSSNGISESTMNDLTDPAWRRLKAMTEADGKLRAIHCLENENYRDTSLNRTGKGDLIRALELFDPHLIIHLTVANEEEIKLLKKSGKTGVLNPRANANLGLRLPPIPQLLDAKINLLLGTDNGMLNSPNMLAELDYTYKITKALYGNIKDPKPVDILKMATSNIHEAIGGDHYGYLDNGLPASFAVLNFNAPHLRFTHHIIASILSRVTPEDVALTIHRGRPLYKNNNINLS